LVDGKDAEGIRNENEGQEVETRGQQGGEERVGSTVRSVWTVEMRANGLVQYFQHCQGKKGKRKDSNFNRSQWVLFLNRYGLYGVQSIILNTIKNKSDRK
jgi:hypothetical protein